MSRAVLSLGSNQGDPLAHLQAAVEALRPWLVAISPVYRTPPWGPVSQDDYRNAVMIVSDPDVGAERWLERGAITERARGRRREVRWGPRTLDVDVVTVDDERRTDPHLTLPHPRAAERAFVLVPWLALDPDAELPGHGPVAQLLAALPPDEVAAVELRPDEVLR